MTNLPTDRKNLTTKIAKISKDSTMVTEKVVNKITITKITAVMIGAIDPRKSDREEEMIIVMSIADMKRLIVKHFLQIRMLQGLIVHQAATTQVIFTIK